jgi:hypothetical protein
MGHTGTLLFYRASDGAFNAGHFEGGHLVQTDSRTDFAKNWTHIVAVGFLCVRRESWHV